MKKKTFNLICIVSSAAVLAILAITAGVRLRNRKAAEPIVIGQAVIDVISINTIEVTPEPTPAPDLPEYAVTVFVGRRPVLSLASEPEAQRLLWEYLRTVAVAPEGESFVSASFDQEIIIGSVDADVKVLAFDEALQTLLDTPALIPVRLTTERTALSTGETTMTVGENAALPKGTRIVTQVGAGEVTRTTVTAQYVAGEETLVSEPRVAVEMPARATIVKTGTYVRKDTSGVPEKAEGVHGKDAGTLKLRYPMQGSVVLRYGYCEGVMHNGLDIESEAGAKVVSPGEGVVIYMGERGAYGYVVDIDHGNGFVSRLTHLQEPAVELNQRVFAGDLVGTLAPLSDSRDKPHLHYELIIDNVPYNPEFYIS